MNNRAHDSMPLPGVSLAGFKLRLLAAAALLALAGLLGAWGGWELRGGELPAMEVVSKAPEVRQGDGSLLAAREPQAKPLPPPHAIPKGSREERRISATVSPAKPDCPPLRLDLSLVQDEAGGRRVVASSPDGEVIQALDMPVVAALLPQPTRPWAAGVSWTPREELGGVWLERDLGRLRLGADIEEAGRGELLGRVRVGWRFSL